MANGPVQRRVAAKESALVGIRIMVGDKVYTWQAEAFGDELADPDAFLDRNKAHFRVLAGEALKRMDGVGPSMLIDHDSKDAA